MNNEIWKGVLVLSSQKKLDKIFINANAGTRIQKL